MKHEVQDIIVNTKTNKVVGVIIDDQQYVLTPVDSTPPVEYWAAKRCIREKLASLANGTDIMNSMADDIADYIYGKEGKK